MSSAVHSDRAKEQIACKVFIQCIKHTAAQSKLSVPLFFFYLSVNEQIPESAQMPLFTQREHFEQKSLVKHNS